MKPLAKPLDITVQKLLHLDPHLAGSDVYRAIGGLIERCEPAQLERVQAALAGQLLENWPAPQWDGALQQLLQSSIALIESNQIVRCDLHLAMLLLQANARLNKCRQQVRPTRPGPLTGIAAVADRLSEVAIANAG